MDGESTNRADGARLHERTWVDSTRDIVVDLVGWLARLDWLTAAAWVLTLGCLGCAILDSYTSLCTVGATLGHIGDKSACWEFGGWDTRVFPLAVDMGWGGALFAVLRLARSIGMGSWRWWVVLLFEALTAAFTIAGNAFHGAVVSGATGSDLGGWGVLITCVASAVPGVTAVGSGFTLSVLVSTRMARRQQPGEKHVARYEPDTSQVALPEHAPRALPAARQQRATSHTPTSKRGRARSLLMARTWDETTRAEVVKEVARKTGADVTSVRRVVGEIEKARATNPNPHPKEV